MEPRKWKKIVLAITVAFGLVFTFWYGGGSAGLHGFSVTEESKEYTVDAVQGEAGGDETVRQDGEQTEDVKEKSAGNDREKPAEKKNIFQQFFMHITKKDNSGSHLKKAVQNSQTAKKNANKAADKAKKKNKKSKNKNKTANKKTTDKENTEKGGTDTDQSEQGNSNNENRAGVNTDEQAAAEQTTEALKTEDMISCTISISCAILLDHMNDLKEAKKTQVPKDGVILGETTVKVKTGSTVFDVLQSVTKTKKIHLEYSFTPGFKSYYIEGIHNLYEFDAGDLSGWMYSVNGDFPGDSCSAYNVEDGDVIQWVYTCNLGKDVGGYFKE